MQKVFDTMYLEPELLEKVIGAIKSSANADFEDLNVEPFRAIDLRPRLAF